VGNFASTLSILQQAFGDHQQPPVWESSLDYLSRRAQVQTLADGLPALLASDTTAWVKAKAAVTASAAAGAPGPALVEAQSQTKLVLNATQHALAWDLPTFTNELKGWFDMFGVIQEGTPGIIDPVPELPKNLVTALSRLMAE